MVRTRFAPSPSGYLHIGGARTALFNYLYAKSQKGKFIIRVEDTDRERSSPESEKMILDSLNWLGIKADEGVIEKGDYGPYRQSDRLDIYAKYTKKLLEQNLAYPCFCTDQELEKKKQESRILGKAHIYDRKCRNLSPEEIENRKKQDLPYAIRFKVEADTILINDMIQGKVKFDTRLIGDFIIQKSNSFPSYNYAVVLDDNEMKITHVIRGVAHLSNTPRQILIYKALGWELPHYAHSSEIVGTDHKKLSKRRGATSILLFKELGYLPEAFVNYMSLLGWSPKDNREFLSMKELESIFSIENCSKSPSMFDFFLIPKNEENNNSLDIENENTKQTLNQKPNQTLNIEKLKSLYNKKSKLNWLNNLYIRLYDLDDLWNLALPFISSHPYLNKYLEEGSENILKKAFSSLRVYLSNLSEVNSYLSEIFKEEHKLSLELKQELEEKEVYFLCLQNFCDQLEKKQPKEAEDFALCMKEVGKELDIKAYALYMPIRIASTGTKSGLELPILFSILGWKNVIDRIKQTIKSLKIEIS